MRIENFSDINPNDITHILFDWGGVIINIDHHKTIAEFNKLVDGQFERIYTPNGQNTIFDKLETGKISENEFYDAIRSEFNIDTDNKTLRSAWCSILQDVPAERIDLLRELKRKNKIYLLSNTNAVHVHHAAIMLKEQHNLDFFGLFNGTYLSHDMGYRKPNRGYFDYTIEKEGLNLQKCIFIDDTEINVDAAASVGLNAYFLQGDQTILDLFENWS